MAGFITFWSKEYIKELEKAKDNGPWSVIFGSQHSKMPSISSIHVGDTVYPVALLQGTLCVMAKMPVELVEIAFDYLIRETGQIHSALVPDGFALEHEYNAGGFFYLTNAGHYESRDNLPKGTKLLIPKEMPLKLNNKGVPTAMSLSSTRRMSEATQEQFERLFSTE